jgi:hypothetical protein
MASCKPATDVCQRCCAWAKHLGGDRAGDETHDALAVFHPQSLPGVAEAPGQAIDPQATVRIEHDLDDGRIFQPARDRRPHRRTQHANAA